MKDLGLVLTHDLIRNIIQYHELGWLPVLPATVALMMRVADYFCDVWVLESFSKEYKIPVDSLRSIDAYQPQKWLIRDAFRQRLHIYEKFHRGNCGLCGEFVTELSCLRLQIVESPKDPHIHLSCCGSLAHVLCLRKLKSPICPCCNAGWRRLPCFVCGHHMSNPESEGNIYKIYQSYVRALPFRTKCCGADAHADCFDNYSLKKCVICQTQWDTERNPIFGERGGSDYVYSSRALYLNEKHRRELTHYFTRPDWTTGSIIDYSMPYRP